MTTVGHQLTVELATLVLEEPDDLDGFTMPFPDEPTAGFVAAAQLVALVYVLEELGPAAVRTIRAKHRRLARAQGGA